MSDSCFWYLNRCRFSFKILTMYMLYTIVLFIILSDKPTEYTITSCTLPCKYNQKTDYFFFFLQFRFRNIASQADVYKVVDTIRGSRTLEVHNISYFDFNSLIILCNNTHYIGTYSQAEIYCFCFITADCFYSYKCV